MIKDNLINLKVKDNLIGVMKVGNIEYISLTDIARYKNPDNPSDVLKFWMSNKNSFEFYSLWEELFNPDFNSVESHRIKVEEVGYNSFIMTPTKWKKRTNCIGIIPSSGRYSKGTFAHPDIALEFASWIDTGFKLYLIKEFERLKVNEAYLNKKEWNVRRSISKTNYRIHTNSIKENIVPFLTDIQKKYVYSDEAELLNVALFGMTSKEWRKNNPNLKGNIRDNTDITHLIVLSNLEVLNSNMISEGINQIERIDKLNKEAIKQLTILYENNNIKEIELIEKNVDSKTIYKGAGYELL